MNYYLRYIIATILVESASAGDLWLKRRNHTTTIPNSPTPHHAPPHMRGKVAAATCKISTSPGIHRRFEFSSFSRGHRDILVQGFRWGCLLIDAACTSSFGRGGPKSGMRLAGAVETDG